jgi:hypothetical protein
MEAHRPGRRGRSEEHDTATEDLAASESPGGDVPYARYPCVFPNLPGREATDEEFRGYFGELDHDDEP